MKLLSLLALMLTFYVPASYAGKNGPFTVVCTGGCTGATATALQLLEDDINNDLPNADASNYLTGMGNASVMSVKGTGSDYANEVDLFIVKASAGIGVDVGDQSLGDLDAGKVRGFGVSPSLTIGLNPGALFDLPEWEYFDMNKLRVFVNFFSFDTETGGANVEASNFGIHARYKLIDPIAVVPGKMVYWSGVDIHTGFDVASLKVIIKQTENQTFESGIVDANINGTITAGADISTVTIPIEASTGVQLGYILSLYTGLGLDINTGTAKSIVNLDAPITLSGTGDTAQGSLDLGQEGSPTSVAPRAFLGTQFNISLLKLGVKLDKSLSDGAYGVNVNLGVTW